MLDRFREVERAAKENGLASAKPCACWRAPT